MAKSLVKELFEQGQKELTLRGKGEESTKSGILRGGSSGIVLDNGDHAGKCLSQSFLRFKGIDTSALDNENEGTKGYMFEAGHTNEISWLETLKASPWTGTILQESEVPIKWETSNGIKVTGRPDMVLVNEQKEKVVGIELKLVSSIWTARCVLINRTPKLAHLIQAGHYSWKLETPFELWYTSRVNWETSADFNLQSYPRYGEEGSENFSYRFYRAVADPKTGRFKKQAITEVEFLAAPFDDSTEAIPGKYLPFVQGFTLQFDTKGRLWYTSCHSPHAEAQQTVITKKGIESYYEKLSTLEKVPQEPTTIKPDGKKESFKLSSYCSLGNLCCKFRAGQEITSWTKEVQEEVEKKKQNKEGDSNGVT